MDFKSVSLSFFSIKLFRPNFFSFQRKSSALLPFLLFTFLEIFLAIYLLVSSMIVINPREEYELRMKGFIERINIPESTIIGVWIYLYLCICSLYDEMRCDENEKKMLSAKESITYGAVDDNGRLSNL